MDACVTANVIGVGWFTVAPVGGVRIITAICFGAAGARLGLLHCIFFTGVVVTADKVSDLASLLAFFDAGIAVGKCAVAPVFFEAVPTILLLKAALVQLATLTIFASTVDVGFVAVLNAVVTTGSDAGTIETFGGVVLAVGSLGAGVEAGPLMAALVVGAVHLVAIEVEAFALVAALVLGALFGASTGGVAFTLIARFLFEAVDAGTGAVDTGAIVADLGLAVCALVA